MAAIQQAFDAAYWASLPTLVRTLSNQSLNQGARIELCMALESEGYAAYMVGAIDSQDWDPFEWASIAAMDGYTFVPNISQIPIGDAKQYAAPGLKPLPDQLGAYPTTIPEGWIVVPPIAQLSAPGADVAALLAKWYQPYVAPVKASA